jgi:hypothetical protein
VILFVDERQPGSRIQCPARTFGISSKFAHILTLFVHFQVCHRGAANPQDIRELRTAVNPGPVESLRVTPHPHTVQRFELVARPSRLVQNELRMQTDAPPRKRNLRSFLESDRLNRLLLPTDDRLPRIACSIESGMKAGKTREVLRFSEEFLAVASDFYRVRRCAVRVLAARPLRVRGCSTIELFGDYHPDTILIRVWMRTAVRKEVTSFGTFLSTLCHEFCHHLDFERFPDSWHTRGFYERTAALYHHAKGTPPKRLVWVPLRGKRWRIDWPRTNGAGLKTANGGSLDAISR